MQREAKTERIVVYVTPAQTAAVATAAQRLGSRGAVVRQALVLFLPQVLSVSQQDAGDIHVKSAS